jgi:type II secretion system protein H
MATRATSATGDRGFTLLELMVVLAILVLVASAWPLASSHVFAAQRLRNEAQHLAGALRAGQMTARITGVPQELQISPQGTTYSIGEDTHSLPEEMSLRLRTQPEPGFASTVMLFPDGSSTGGTLDLSLHERVTILEVRQMTGRLEVSP